MKVRFTGGAEEEKGGWTLTSRRMKMPENEDASRWGYEVACGSWSSAQSYCTKVDTAREPIDRCNCGDDVVCLIKRCGWLRVWLFSSIPAWCEGVARASAASCSHRLAVRGQMVVCTWQNCHCCDVTRRVMLVRAASSVARRGWADGAGRKSLGEVEAVVMVMEMEPSL